LIEAIRLIYRIVDSFGSSGESRYAALIGDVVASRRIEGRLEFQERLEGLLRRLNGDLGDGALAAPLILTAGDEIQGLFQRPGRVLAAVVGLADELFPARLVYGLGYGELSTELSPDSARMDGPCFHRARRALESVKRRGGWLAVDGFGQSADSTLSTLFFLMDAIRSRWTARQVQYIREVRHARHQKDVAAAFRVSPSVVSESLKAASFAAVRQGEGMVEKILGEFGVLAEVPCGSVAEPNGAVEIR
jgi:hypothetical protein